MPSTAACVVPRADAGHSAPCLDSTPRRPHPARPANPYTCSSFSVSTSPLSSLTPPLHLLALASLVLLGCPIPAACDPASGTSTAAITAALLSSSSLQQQHQRYQQQQTHRQLKRQRQQQHPRLDHDQTLIQLPEVHRRNQKRRLTESTGHGGRGRGRDSGRDTDGDHGRIWLMHGRSLTSHDDHNDTGVVFPSAFSSASRLSNLSTTETTLAGLLGVALALALLAVCVCLVRKQRWARSWSLSRSEPSSLIPSQPQQLAVPLYQPPETSSSLSSFTRVSAAGPEMSSVLAAAGARSAGLPPSPRSPSSSAVVGFSLARLFVRQPRERSAEKSGKSVYMHQKDPIQDWRSQKTPSPVSTRSTSHDYCWGDMHSKEYSKDGFPVITLTSPTNSESSIPIPVASTDTTGASSSTASTSSTRMALPEQPAPGFFHDHALSKTASLKDMDETLAPVSEDKGSPTPSIYAADPRDFHLVRQSVPQHMLLHPSSSHNRIPRFEKQTPAPPSTSPPSLTDFPPTYEEAVDVLVVSNKSTDDGQGSSNGSCNNSNSSNSNSSHSNKTNNTSNNGSCDEITSISELALPAPSLFPSLSPYPGSPRAPSTGSMDWASYRNRTEWNAEYGAEGEVDPLGSLSLSSSH